MFGLLQGGDYAEQIDCARIIGALKQVEAGRTAEDVAREQGVSKHTIYAWKAKYGGMDVREAEEVKHLRDENSRLKKLVADPITTGQVAFYVIRAVEERSMVALSRKSRRTRICDSVRIS
jgi:putative transposase